MNNTAKHNITRPVAVSKRGFASLFPFGVRTIERMDATGQCPRPHRVGGRLLWNVSDLDRWAEMGYPNRENFEAEGGQR